MHIYSNDMRMGKQTIKFKREYEKGTRLADLKTN